MSATWLPGAYRFLLVLTAVLVAVSSGRVYRAPLLSSRVLGSSLAPGRFIVFLLAVAPGGLAVIAVLLVLAVTSVVPLLATVVEGRCREVAVHHPQ